MDEPELHETTQKTQPKQWRFTILHSCALFILFVVLQGCIYFLIKNLTGLDPVDWRWYHFCIQNGVSGWITAIAGAYLNGFSLQSMLFDHLPDLGGVFAAVLAAVGVVILSSELDNILRFLIPISADTQILVKLMNEDFVGVAIAGVIVAPIVEELLFRGVILDGLRLHYSVFTAVVVSSFLFGLGHFNVFISLNTFFLALFLAWIRLHSSSLMLCVITHCAFNATQLIAGRILGKEISGFNIPSGTVQFQPLWFDALGLLLLAIGIAGLKALNHEEHEVHEDHEM